MQEEWLFDALHPHLDGVKEFELTAAKTSSHTSRRSLQAETVYTQEPCCSRIVAQYVYGRVVL